MDGLKARLSFDAVAYDYDDEYLTIDTDTHTININNVSRLFGVQYDGNSKLIKFRVRNKLSDIQKMQDSIVYINWIDSRGVKGQSIAINKTINNDTCEFAWKVPFDALKNSGVLHFAMSAVVTKNSSSVIDQRWSTKIASVITPDGIYIKSYTPSSEEEDRIAQIYNELSNMINKQNDNLSDMQSQVNLLKEELVTTNTLLTGIGTIVHSQNIDTPKSVTVMFDSAINKGVTIWICNTSTTDFDNNKTISVNLIQRDGSEKSLGLIAKGGAFNVTLEKDIVGVRSWVTDTNYSFELRYYVKRNDKISVENLMSNGLRLSVIGGNIPVKKGYELVYDSGSNYIDFMLYNNDKMLYDSNWIKGKGIYTIEKDSELRILLANKQTYQESEFISPLDFDGEIEINKSSVNANNRIDEVKKGIDEYKHENNDVIPSYYKNHIAEKIKLINKNMADVGKDGDTFIFITDIHWDNNNKHSPALIKEICRKTNIKNIICGGDIINEGDYEIMCETMIDCVHNFDFGDGFFSAFGNHDSNKNNQSSMPERWFSDSAVYAFMYKQNDGKIIFLNDIDKSFYFDNTTTKTRYIILDTGVDGKFDNQVIFTSFINTLIAVEEGWNIIIFAHWLYNNSWYQIFYDLKKVVDGYNSKTKAEISTVSKTYDLTSAKATISSVFSGHMHMDMDAKTDNGIPVILTDSDNGVRSANTDYPYVQNTITEQCFDVVSIDYKNRTVKCVRVGRGADRNFTF